MALTDLTNTKWLFNNSISSYEDVTYHINFTSNSTSFSQLISIEGNHSVHYDSTSVYSRGSWVNEAYKTIEITGGTDVTNANLISWLESNATQVIETTTDIVIGNNTLTGVDTIKLTDASDDSNKIDFTYGATPSGTVNVKLGGNTLTGVNEISVRGTDNISKSFGYVSTPSGININICELQESGYAFYSLNDGAETHISRDNYIEYPWTFALIQSKSLPLSNVTKLEVGGNGTEMNKVYIYNSSGEQIYNASLGSYTLVDITSNLVDGCYVAIQTEN